MILSNKLSNAEVIELSERLTEIAGSPYPLPDGLKASAKSVRNRRVRQGMLRIAECLTRGTNVQQAMHQSIRGIPPFLVGLLHVGAKNARLPAVLVGLCDHYRETENVRAQIWSALWYPIIVVAAFLLLVVFICNVIVPPFVEIYVDFDTDLPPLTEGLIHVSSNFSRYFIPFVICFAVVSIAIRLIGGPANWCRLIGAIPGFGALIRWSAFTELLQLLRLQLSQNVPIPESLRSGAAAIRDANVRNIALTLAAQVDNGWSLSSAMEVHPDVPGGITPIIRWGEVNDRLPDAIDSITEMLSGRIRFRASLIVKTLPPIMLMVVGISIGFLVLALMVPLVGLIRYLGM